MFAWLSIMVCIGLVVNGVRLRGRLRRLDTLPVSGRPVDPAHEFLVANGVTLTDRGRRAASYHASRDRLDVLDLVPADLTVERALDLARMVDTRTYRNDRCVPGRGAFQALLVRSEILDRAGIDRRDGFDPVELVDITEQLKTYASGSTDLAVLPGLRAARDDAAMRVRVQQRAYRFTRQNRIFPFIPQIVTGIGVHTDRPWGLAATALFWFQPFFVCAGRVPLNPRDLIRSPIVRVLGGALFVIDSVRAGRAQAARAAEAKAAGLPADPVKAAARRDSEARRASYARDTHAGVDRFLAPARDDCPWCGSVELATRLKSGELLLGKPGSFRLDGCRRCGHVFLNPPLRPAGQEFYQRDLFDGPRAEVAQQDLAMIARDRRAQVAAVRPFVVPRTWLDVGTRYGHLPNAAREMWPRTAFDGTDTFPGLATGLARGWIDQALPGRFRDIAGEIAGRYDVISMFDYLERSDDPSVELDAAVKALPPGGHLLCELVNPDCRQARGLGRFWPGWAVPLRAHFIPVENLVAALEDRGLRPVLVRFGASRRPGDLTGALLLAIGTVVPRSTPWLRQPAGPARLLARILVMTVASPLLVLLQILDRLARRYLRSSRYSGSCLVIARKEL